jgi:hypothetical protein
MINSAQSVLELAKQCPTVCFIELYTQPVLILISNEKEKNISIYATTAASKPAKTPMATPLTLFLSAALVWVGVGLGVLDEDSLDEVDSTVLVLDADTVLDDPDNDDEPEVDCEVLVLKIIKHEIKGQVVKYDDETCSELLVETEVVAVGVTVTVVS